MALDVDDLYRRHAPQVWRYVRARVPTEADAEDVTADAFLRAFRSAGRYDATKGSEAAWLVGIARHAVADWWRRKKPEDASPDVPEQAGADEPTDRALQNEEHTMLHDHLRALSDREREAIAMRFGAELSSVEIGHSLGISPTAARMLVHRAITKLRGAIDV